MKHPYLDYFGANRLLCDLERALIAEAEAGFYGPKRDTLKARNQRGWLKLYHASAYCRKQGWNAIDALRAEAEAR